MISEDKAKVLGSRGQNEGEATPLSSEKVKEAAKVGLSAAAMKAKLFADHEEREIQRLCANMVNHQVHLSLLSSFLNLRCFNQCVYIYLLSPSITIRIHMHICFTQANIVCRCG